MQAIIGPTPKKIATAQGAPKIENTSRMQTESCLYLLWVMSDIHRCGAFEKQPMRRIKRDKHSNTKGNRIAIAFGSDEHESIASLTQNRLTLLTRQPATETIHGRHARSYSYAPIPPLRCRPLTATVLTKRRITNSDFANYACTSLRHGVNLHLWVLPNR